MRAAVKAGAIGQVAAAFERRLERGENLRFAEAVVLVLAAIDLAFHAIDQAMRRVGRIGDQKRAMEAGGRANAVGERLGGEEPDPSAEAKADRPGRAR